MRTVILLGLIAIALAINKDVNIFIGNDDEIVMSVILGIVVSMDIVDFVFRIAGKSKPNKLDKKG